MKYASLTYLVLVITKSFVQQSFSRRQTGSSATKYVTITTLPLCKTFKVKILCNAAACGMPWQNFHTDL